MTHVFPILLGQTSSLEAVALVPLVAWISANHLPRLTHLYLSFYPSIRSPYCLDILHIHRLIDWQGPLVN